MREPTPSLRPARGEGPLVLAGVALAAGTGILNWRMLAVPSFTFPGLSFAESHPALYVLAIGLLESLLVLAAAGLLLSGIRRAGRPPRWLTTGVARHEPLLTGGLLAGWMLLAAAPALHHEFDFDDLYLLRSYPARELLEAFSGPWDTSHTLREAYRPLSTLYLHSAHAALGEVPWRYRVLNAAMAATGIALLFSTFLRQGPPGLSLLAVLVLCGSDSLALLCAWPIQGFRCLQLLLAGLSLRSLQQALQPGRGPLRLFTSILWFAAALLAREETAGLLPVPLAMLAVPSGASRRSRLAAGVAFCAVCAGELVARKLFLDHPGRLYLDGPAALAGYLLDTFSFRGAVPAGLAIVAMSMARGRRARAAWLCGAALLALAPGLGAFRVDVGVLTLIFLAMPAAIGFEHIWRRRAGARIFLLALAMITLSSGLTGGWVRMQDLNVLSLNSIRRNGGVLSGEVGPSLSFVPTPRRERLAALYAGLGVDIGPGFSTWLKNELETAEATRRFNPDGSGRPYRYAWDFLSSRPNWWNVMSIRVGRAASAFLNQRDP